MNTEFIWVTIISSLISGILGVFVSSWFYSRLEKMRMKTETARKLFANRHNIHGNDFHEAMNEIMIIFSDSQEIINLIDELFKTVETPKPARRDKAADDILVKLMKAICKDIGVIHKTLPDSYYLKFFSMPK